MRWTCDTSNITWRIQSSNDAWKCLKSDLYLSDCPVMHSRLTDLPPKTPDSQTSSDGTVERSVSVERLWMKGFLKQRSFKSRVKGRGSDIGDKSEGGDCDEVICAVRGEPGGEWTEWGWRNEEGSWFHNILKATSCWLYNVLLMAMSWSVIVIIWT